MARRSLGRQKIAMRRMANESNLLVTFSKRRSGLFKKASELCTLCGIEIAMIVFSPGNKKVFSFGHPNLKHVIDKFINPENSNPAADSGMLQPMNPLLAELIGHLSMLDDHLEAQTAYGERLDNQRRQRQGVDWFETPVEDLGLEQLQMLKSGLTELKTMVSSRKDSLAMMLQANNLASTSSEGGEPVDAGGAALGITVTPHGYALC